MRPFLRYRARREGRASMPLANCAKGPKVWLLIAGATEDQQR